jgi:hypothetical protein
MLPTEKLLVCGVVALSIVWLCQREDDLNAETQRAQRKRGENQDRYGLLR